MKVQPFLFTLLSTTLIIGTLSSSPSPLSPPYQNFGNQTEECQKIIEGIVNTINNNSTQEQVGQYVLLSGHALNDYGNYEKCQTNDTLAYSIIQFDVLTAQGYNITRFTGLCLPEQCQAEYINPYMPQLTDYLNAVIEKNQLPGKIWNSTAYDASYPSTKSSGFVFAVLLLAGLISIVSFATYFTQITRHKHEDLIRQRFKKKPKGDESVALEEGSQEYNKLVTEDLDESQVYDELYPYRKNKMLVFSFVKNWDFIFDFTENPWFLDPENHEFRAVYGVKVLLMIWAAFGLEYYIRFQAIQNVNSENLVIEKLGWTTFARAATFVPDVFFFLAGFLNFQEMYILIKDTTDEKQTLINTIIWKLIKIWPAYAIGIFFYQFLATYSNSGPIWYIFMGEADQCTSMGWQNILFIDNLFNHGSDGLRYCFPWGFFLSNYFQFLLFVPFIVYLYKTSRMKAWIFAWILFIGSLAANLGIVFGYEISMPYPEASNTNEPNYMTLYYYKPWIRIAPFALGLLTALFYFDGMNGERLSKNFMSLIKRSWFAKFWLLLAGNFLTLFVIGLIITQQKSWDTDNPFTQIYLALSRTLLPLGFALTLYPSFIAKDSFFNVVLGSRIMYNISQLSYPVYLVMPIVIMRSFFGQKITVYFDTQHQVYFCIADTVVSIFVSIIYALLLTIPCAQLKDCYKTPTRADQQKHSVEYSMKDMERE